MSRTDLTFPSGDGRCAAWLYTPEGGGVRAVIVMAHGLGCVREMRLDAFAERFTAAGYACLVFDYRHFGASSGEPRQLLDVGRQREDWRSAVRFARSLPDVDPDRLVVWGTSFSGGHVIATAAEDQPVAAVIAQCPFTDGLASTLTVPPLTSLRLTWRALRDQVGSWLGRKPVLVPTYGPPGSVSLMSAPDCEPGIRALIPAGAQVEGRVAARFVLQLVRQLPGRRARRITAPAMYVVCDRDTVAPARATLRHLRRSPRGEIVRVPQGHFDIYVGAAFEQNVASQVEFLARHVPA